MKTKHTLKTKRTKRPTAADRYWRGKLREYEDCLRRARATQALPDSEARTSAMLVIIDELDGWLDLMEEMGI